MVIHAVEYRTKILEDIPSQSVFISPMFLPAFCFRMESFSIYK